MKELKLDTEYLYKLGKEFREMHAHIVELKPDVYIDGDSYCCISGPNPEEGIFGCGDTPEDALASWEKDYEKKKRGVNHPNKYTYHFSSAFKSCNKRLKDFSNES